MQLYRAVDKEELHLIRENGNKRFPKGLKHPPVFSNLLARRAAKELFQKSTGYVVVFFINAEYIKQFTNSNRELAVPNDSFEDFNDHIKGVILAIEKYEGNKP